MSLTHGMPDMGADQDKKSKGVTAEVEKKMREEQAQYAAHAAEYYMSKVLKLQGDDRLNRRWKAILDPAEVDAAKPQANDPKAQLQTSATTSFAKLLFKDGLYENKNGARVFLENGKIYLRKGCSIEDAFDFAMSAQGGMLKGIKYDVGADACSHTSDAFINYRSRLQEINDFQKLATKQEKENIVAPATLNDKTKEFLKFLVEEKKLSVENYKKIIDKDEHIQRMSQNTQSKILNKVRREELEKSTANIAPVDKAALSQKDTNKDPEDTANKALMRNASDKLAKMQNHAALLNTLTDDVNKQLDKIGSDLKTIAECKNTQGDPHKSADEKKEAAERKERIEQDLEKNKWYTDPIGQKKLLEHQETHMQQLITNTEEIKKAVEDAIKGNDQDKHVQDVTKATNDQKKATDEHKKAEDEYKKAEDEYKKAAQDASKVDDAAKKLLTSIEQYNKDKPDDQKIKIQETPPIPDEKLAELNDKLKLTLPEPVTKATLETAQYIASDAKTKALLEKIDTYNKANAANIIDINTTTLVDINTKLTSNNLITAAEHFTAEHLAAAKKITHPLAHKVELENKNKTLEAANTVLTAASTALTAANTALEDYKTKPDPNPTTKKGTREAAREEYAKLKDLETKVKEALDGKQDQGKPDPKNPGLKKMKTDLVDKVKDATENAKEAEKEINKISQARQAARAAALHP